MRVLPQRWWYPVVGALIGFMLGAALGARISGSETSTVLWGGAFGAVAGALIGVAIVTMAAPHDSRLIALRRQLPDAIVVQALRDEENSVVIAELAGRAPARRFTVVVDPSGASIWGADAQPERYAELEWHEIAAFRVGGMVRPTRFGTRAYFRLILARSADDAPDLLFGVERVPAFPGGRTTLSDGELASLAERLNDLRPPA